MDGFDNLPRRAPFEDISGRSRFNRGEHVLAVLIDRMRHDLKPRHFFFCLLYEIYSGHARQADIRAIVADTQGRSTNLAPLDRAVLQAARELTAQPNLSDATFAQLRNGLDNERIVDLVLTISFYCGVVRMLAALQIDVEDDYLHYLQEFPLPA